MKIHYNETFNCYETTEQDCKFGKEITLDGKLLVPASDKDFSFEEVKELYEEIKKEKKTWSNPRERDGITALNRVLCIFNSYLEKKEKARNDIQDTTDILKDLYFCPNLEDFMIETFGYLTDVSDLMFNSKDHTPQEIAVLYLNWKESQKEEDLER